MLPDVACGRPLMGSSTSFQSASRFAVLPDPHILLSEGGVSSVSIRFEVRGAPRQRHRAWARTARPFQSASRFAVLPDRHHVHSLRGDCVSIRFEVRGASRLEVRKAVAAKGDVSIRFEVRGASRRGGSPSFDLDLVEVSIRFEVRGASRPYPMTRCPDKPCCGGFTHHPSSPPPSSGQNLS